MAHTTRPKTTTSRIYSVTNQQDGLHHTEVTTTHTAGKLGTYGHVASTTVVALHEGGYRKDFQIIYRDGQIHTNTHPLTEETGRSMIDVFTKQYEHVASLPTPDYSEPITRTLRKKR